MQARYYDPSVGRFLSIDPKMPAAGNYWTTNRFSYTNDNPANNVDPDGRVVQIPATGDRKTVVGLINKLSSTQYVVDKNGNLKASSSPSSLSGSTTYSKVLDAAIKSSEIVTVQVAQTVTNSFDGQPVSVDEKGGGATQGGKGNPPGENGQLVTISGHPSTKLKDTTGAPLKDDASDILMHELVGHAEPRINGDGTGNAVQDENKVRQELPGGQQRKAESGHWE